MLPGTGLGDDPLLAETAGEHGLAECVVQLVRSRVQKILSLQVEPLAGSEALGQGERGGAARIGGAERVQLGTERRVA